jgi:PKD repeat protein
MKKNLRNGSFLILAMVFAISFSSCKKEVLPTASFTYSPSDVVFHEEIQFTSTSTDAESYSWDFGGTIITEMNPKVTFLNSGDVTVKLTVTNGDGSHSTEQVIEVKGSTYMLGDVEYDITTDFFWSTPPQGGDPHLRLLTQSPVSDTIVDLMKLYPNKGLDPLEQVYTWEPKESGIISTYDVRYTADLDGFSWDWTSIGKTGSNDLLIEEVDTDIYRISGDMVLSVGHFDFSTGEFVEESTTTLELNYVGAITPL